MITHYPPAGARDKLHTYLYGRPRGIGTPRRTHPAFVLRSMKQSPVEPVVFCYVTSCDEGVVFRYELALGVRAGQSRGVRAGLASGEWTLPRYKYATLYYM